MIVISTTGLSLSFGTTTVLEDISFALDETDKLGIIGVNGCGKSSLLRMITGEYTPTGGSVFISKGKTVGILRQDDAFVTDGEYEGTNTVIEHMYHAFPELLETEKRLDRLERDMQDITRPDYDILTREFSSLHERYIANGGLEFRSRCASILAKIGFAPEVATQDVRTLSGGQKTRLALAIQLSREPDILILDEPTNHLDIQTLSWLESFLISYKKCVMIVSHDRYFLDRVTNKTLAVQNHHAKLYRGNYTKSMEQREADRIIQQKHYDDQQKELARQQAFLDQQRRWGQEHNFVTIRAREKLLEKMVRVEKPERAPKPIKMKFQSALASGNDVLSIKRLSMGFDGKMLFSDVSFEVKKGERVLIIGRNGCGKSTLIKMIIGSLAPLSGRIEAGYNVVVGYYDQENQNLDPNNSVIDELWDAYPRLTETEIRSALGLFRFVGDAVFKPVSVLSGGERARLTLCKLMMSEMNLLILDEPTNHLDIESREVLENALSGFDGTIIVVSHDRYLIEKLATRIIELKPEDGFVGDVLDFHVDYDGRGFTEFSTYRAARVAEHQPTESQSRTETVSDNKAQYLRSKQEISNAKKKKHRIERLHADAERLESEIDELDRRISGEAATDYVLLAELDTRKTQAEEELLAVYGELDELEKE